MQPLTDKSSLRHARRTEKGVDCRVFVGNLDPTWNEAEVLSALAPFGKVVQATVCRNSYGQSKAYGFVTFARPEEASSSYGQLQFKNRILEVKACIRKQDKIQGSHKNMTHLNTLVQKEYIGVQALNQTRAKLEPSPPAKTKTVRLNKNSKNFDKVIPLTDDQTTIESDSGKIAISIIKVADDHTTRSEEDVSQSSSSSGVQKFSKPLSDKPGISKLSKEFHPARPPLFSQQSSLSELSPIGGFYQPMLNPYLVFQPGFCRSDSEVNHRDGLRTVGTRASATADFKISFFTFPGRD
jgi:hypothetical protein